MMEDIKSILTFNEYKVISIEFKLNVNCNNKKINLDFDIEKEITYNKEEKSGEVRLVTKVFENPEENNYPFFIKIELLGLFEVASSSDEQCKNLLNTNAVAILFPYIRALISTYTANANVPPLILPAINVNKLIDSKE